MKLLVQADDFGFTKGTTYGAMEGIENGIITCSGLFSNMPAASIAAEFIKKHKGFCFGLDFNITNGPSVSNPAEISHLVDENGEFIRSHVRLRDPRFQTEEGRKEMFPYEECYIELAAQYHKFVELTGETPHYLQAHSLAHENYLAVLRAFAKEKDIPYAMDVIEGFRFEKYVDRSGNEASNQKVFDPVAQLERSPLDEFWARKEKLLDFAYVFAGGHAGFVDAELLRLSSCSIERCKDLEFCTSDKVKKWIHDNHVELISYDDLDWKRPPGAS